MGAARRRFANFLDTYLQHHLIRQDQENQSDLIGARQKELAEQQNTQRMLEAYLKDPISTRRAIANGVTRVGGTDLRTIAPSDDEMLGNLYGEMGKAKTINDLPTDLQLEGQVRGIPGMDGRNPVTIEQLVAARNERDKRLRLDMPPVQSTGYNPNTRTTETTFNPGDPRQLTGKVVQTAPTPQQLGENKGIETETETPYTIAATNKTEKETRKEKVATAGQTAGAQAGAAAAATAPYHPTLLLDDKNNVVPMQFGPKGGVEEPMPRPLFNAANGGEGANAGRPPASVVTMNASANTAEITGVKILAQMKQLGMDKSNDWLDPKITQWMVGTLGMSPSEAAVSDINQRANYVQAALLRSLMAGRPSKYLAELYTKHIPSAMQSPKLLAHQLRLALEENATQRLNMKASYPDLPEPLGGMTLQQWLTTNPDDTEKSKGQSKLELLRGGGAPVPPGSK